MNKLKVLAVSLLLASTVTVPVAEAQDWGRLLQGGLELLQSFTVSDDQVKSYVSQFIGESDRTSQVAPANSKYTVRLNRIVNGITSVDGQPLNFKVYMTNDINAFACADGSVRVYSGLMDAMTDDEVLGVLGHEIGHVAHHDTRNAMKAALRTAALKDAIASAGGTVAILTDSQLGALGEAYINAKYSRKQESNADDYGYTFLKNHGRNPLVLCLAFKKLQALDKSSGTSALVSKLFSSHPDTQTRINALEKKAFKEGYTYPTQTGSGGTSVSKSGSSVSKSSSGSGTTTSKTTSKSKSKSTSKKKSRR